MQAGKDSGYWKDQISFMKVFRQVMHICVVAGIHRNYIVIIITTIIIPITIIITMIIIASSGGG